MCEPPVFSILVFCVNGNIGQLMYGVHTASTVLPSIFEVCVWGAGSMFEQNREISDVHRQLPFFEVYSTYCRCLSTVTLCTLVRSMVLTLLVFSMCLMVSLLLPHLNVCLCLVSNIKSLCLTSIKLYRRCRDRSSIFRRISGLCTREFQGRLSVGSGCSVPVCLSSLASFPSGVLCERSPGSRYVYGCLLHRDIEITESALG